MSPLHEGFKKVFENNDFIVRNDEFGNLFISLKTNGLTVSITPRDNDGFVVSGEAEYHIEPDFVNGVLFCKK